jgi:peptidoglycan/xylan/chitin deacetylase (PgdA/CDA1 family)
MSGHGSAGSTSVSIAPWPRGKRWVYSITFDEALADLHRFAVPILREFGVPGHLEVVVGQMGVPRAVGNSSYNGFKHMSAGELREMLASGWGVGNHSYTHGTLEGGVRGAHVEQELGRAKELLEEAVGEPVTVYCSPGDNSNMNEDALAACRKYGYLGAMSITDALNRPGDADLLWINRTFLHTEGYYPFFSAFDPFRNIQFARHEAGWLIDYCHCPLERAVHPSKDCSAGELRRRIETVVSEGGDEVWMARVEDAIDYRYTRRAAVIEQRDGEIIITASGLHPAVRKRVVTVELPAGTERVEVNGRPVASTRLLDIDLASPCRIRFTTRPAEETSCHAS